MKVGAVDSPSFPRTLVAREQAETSGRAAGGEEDRRLQRRRPRVKKRGTREWKALFVSASLASFTARAVENDIEKRRQQCPGGAALNWRHKTPAMLMMQIRLSSVAVISPSCSTA